MDASRSANSLAARLKATDNRIVLAESCTGGLVAAILVGVPGISQWLCGSAVTYREATKTQWLEVPPELIRQHTAVSREVTEALARRVLSKTPEATIAAAVTGHLGPDAPAELDGVIYISIASTHQNGGDVTTERMRLTSRARADRQRESAIAVLDAVRRTLA